MPPKKQPVGVAADGEPRLPAHQPFDLLTTIESHATALTIEQVAAIFQVSGETIRRMAAQKRIPAFRLGGQVRFNPASLGYWLRQRDPLAAKASKALASRSMDVGIKLSQNVPRTANDRGAMADSHEMCQVEAWS